MPPDLVFLTQDELAERWRMSPRSLERWRCDDYGPDWIRLRGHIIYRLADVESWERERLRSRPDDRG